MTISTALMLVAALGVAIAVCLIGTAVLLEFAWWAVRMLWVQGWVLKRALSRLLIAGVNFCFRTGYKACASSLRFIYELAVTAFVVMAVPLLQRIGHEVRSLRDNMAAKRQHLLTPGGTVALDTGSVPPPAPVPATPSAGEEYEWALSVMGFASGQAVTSVDLKLRYSEMMKVVHPEKGFPNEIFANQTNKARDTIRRIRGWV